MALNLLSEEDITDIIEHYVHLNQNSLPAFYIGYIKSKFGTVKFANLFDPLLLKEAYLKACSAKATCNIDEFRNALHDIVSFLKNHDSIFDEDARYRAPLKNQLAREFVEHYRLTHSNDLVFSLNSFSYTIAMKLGKRPEHLNVYDFIQDFDATLLSYPNNKHIAAFKKFILRVQKKEARRLPPWADEYLEEIKSSGEHSSDKETSIRYFLNWYGEPRGTKLSELHLNELNIDTIKAFNECIYDRLRSGKIAKKTVSDYMYNIRSWLKWMEDNKFLCPIAETIRTIPPPTPGSRRLTIEICEKILETLKIVAPYQFVVIFSMLMTLGCRSCELARLQINDIDFYDRTVLLRGKGDKYRVVPLPSVMIKPLQDYLSIRQRQSSIDQNVFLSRKHKKYSESVFGSTLNYWLKKAMDFIGQTTWPTGVHSIRHSYITELDRMGVQHTEIMQLVGIEKFDTLQDYINVFKSEAVKEFHSKFNPEV